MTQTMLGRVMVMFAGAAAVIFAVACGGGGPERSSAIRATPSAVAAAPSQPGADCAPAVRDEFVRQQRLVAWDVYCPSALPVGFRLARPGDPRATPHLHQDYTPTVSDLNPGGGTFITRLTDGSGRDVWITQGAGASMYVRRDESGRFENSAGSARLGNLAGSLFTTDPPGVTAFDPRGYGHMIEGHGVPSEDVATIAAAMRAVDPAGPHRVLPVTGDLHKIDARWVFAWSPDPTGENVANPVVCAVAVDGGARFAVATARFEPAAGPETLPDAAGHGPFLEEAVVRFDDAASARDYLDRVRQATASCAPYSPMEKVTVTVAPLDAPHVGEQSLTYRRSTRSPVQGADADVAMVRDGALVAVLLHWQTVPAGGAASPVDLTPYAALADTRMRDLMRQLKQAPVGMLGEWRRA